MQNRILIDTNILLDFLQRRKPFYEDACSIFRLCANKEYDACIAAHSIPNLYYILRKEYPSDERRQMIIKLCKIFYVVGIDREKLINGLENKDFSDFEDCLQMECAKEFGAEYIVTRNVSDYVNSTIKAVTPEEYLKLTNKTINEHENKVYNDAQEALNETGQLLKEWHGNIKM